MNLTRFEPWSIVDLLHRDLDRLAGRRVSLGDADGAVTDWVPAVDIVEEKDRFVLRADVPGVKPEDIAVNMENGVLSVSGERHAESTEEKVTLVAVISRLPSSHTLASPTVSEIVARISQVCHAFFVTVGVAPKP